MTNATTLIGEGDYLFGRKTDLLSYWQELADNFYVERADFTVTRNIGQDFASNLTTGFPLLAARDLGSSLSAMLRPSNKEWFAITVDDEESLSFRDREWLEKASKRQREIMYDRAAQFTRATKEADKDFVVFGQAVLQLTTNLNTNSLLYRTWHLRDVAWFEDETGQVSTVHRKWKPTITELVKLFPDKVHAKLKERLAKEPYCTIECRHIVKPTESYNTDKKIRQPFVSVYIDVENGTILEEVGQWDVGYIIPRWQTVSGSQYAYSPCAVVGLPDARLIQAITLTLLEAGEKAVNPPLIAAEQAIRSDISVFAGGVTYVDAEYDEKLGEVLRPITQDKTGLSFGLTLRDDIREMISQAFFLNKINLPPAVSGMTAYEVAQRIQQYIRDVLPLFEPLETDYNGALCEMTFNRLMRMGAFGGAEDIPDALSGKDIKFKFTSPLTDALGREKGQQFLEAKALLAAAAEIDQGAAFTLNAREALKDTLISIQTPAKWLRDDKEIDQLSDEENAKAQTAQMLAAAQQGAAAAKDLGAASQSFANTEMAL